MKTIKALRLRAGLMQTQVALRLGVTAGTISNWESGIREPKPAQLVELCNVLGCTPYELLGMEAGK